MAKSKLITALKSLTAKELSLTKKHIKSKFGESRPELVKLFSVILQQIEQDQIDKIRTWNKVFKKGTLIVFPSFIWHKVNPVIKGYRKVLVGWVLGKPFV